MKTSMDRGLDQSSILLRMVCLRGLPHPVSNKFLDLIVTIKWQAPFLRLFHYCTVFGFLLYENLGHSHCSRTTELNDLFIHFLPLIPLGIAGGLEPISAS